MNLYCLFDRQFRLYSDPFLAADDVTVRRDLVRKAISSRSFRASLSRCDLYLLGDFDASYPDPISLSDHPLLVSTGVSLLQFVKDSSKSLFNGGS